jgi:hypothetical protein
MTGLQQKQSRIWAVPLTSEAWWTLARVTRNGVVTYAAIATWVALTVVNVDLAAVTSETNCTDTPECVDQIIAYASIQAWTQLALIYVNLTLCACETCNSMLQ